MKPTRTRCAFGADDYMNRRASQVFDRPPDDMPLFAQTHAKADDPPAAKAAAKSVSSRAKAQCDAVLGLLKQSSLTAQEFYRRCLELGIQNPRARVSDLRQQGHRIEVKNHEYRLIA